MTKAVIFDIEGTIGDIAFVRNVLFPYARKHLMSFLTANWSTPVIAEIMISTRAASQLSIETPEHAAKQFYEWIDQDKKITPLKTLQGLIWRKGYESGELKAHLYDDAVAAIRRNAANKVRQFIYSSGSIEAQRLYVTHSVAGNISACFENFFDTTTGPKAERASYESIAKAIDLPPSQLVFFSDAMGEVTAAQSAGLAVFHVSRDRATPLANLPAGIPSIESFDQLPSL